MNCTLGARDFSCAVSGFGQVLKSLRPQAEDVSACGRRSSSSQARKKYLVPRVNESSFLIISLSINLYWLNLPCHVSIRLRRSAADFNMGCFYRFINLDVLLQELTWHVWATCASTNILGLALETSRLLANLRYKLR